MTKDELKKIVAYEAVDKFVKSGQKIGLGTGSTAIWAIRRVAEHLKSGKLKNILAVTTSLETEIEAERLGIPLRSLNSNDINGHVDVAIDGADEVSSCLSLVKGGGAALFMEKLVAYNADKFVVVVDESKLVPSIGTGFPVPVEVVPVARAVVARRLKSMRADFTIRVGTGKCGPVITDNGNIIFDVLFKTPVDGPDMERLINSIPGVYENGFFSLVRPIVLVAKSDGAIEHLSD
ncbi:ribose-5-phosphate isomerase RpiA [Spirochaetia bacterium 38H-sp]|uniref:Ribose-5-phosphate isomerase A n=1 Tax=Rarispira pelagica TaxID=3141764 RepID=A0ABU9UBW6_9SPIR